MFIPGESQQEEMSSTAGDRTEQECKNRSPLLVAISEGSFFYYPFGYMTKTRTKPEEINAALLKPTFSFLGAVLMMKLFGS
jgi:hypothetical protein